MKPVLLWCPGTTGSPARWCSHSNGTLAIQWVLDRFKVPYELVGGLVTEGPGVTEFDETAYSVAILPFGRANTTGYKSWLNGSRTIPVVATCCYAANALKKATGCDTGITDNSSGGASAFETKTADGISLCWIAAQDVFTLDAAAEAVLWPVSDPSKASIAKLVGKDVYYITLGSYCDNMSRMLVVLQALKLTGETPRPITLRIDIDDAVTLGATQVQGLYDFADWLRAKRAVAIITLGLEANAPVAEVRNCIIANSDVFRCIIHSHNDSPFLDDEPHDDEEYPGYATIELKLERHAEQVLFYRNQGYTVYPAGPSGHFNLPMNSASRLGRRALAVLGVKSLRKSHIAVEYADSPNRAAFDTTEEDHVCYWYRITPGIGVLIAQDEYTKAELYTAYNATADSVLAAAIIIMSGSGQEGCMLPILSSGPRSVVWCHAGNFADDGTENADNPGMEWFNILDQMVQFSGGWIKWADDVDLAKMATRPKRRVGLGSGAD